MILDLRLIIDRDGIVRASVDGQRIDIPQPGSASDALRMVVSRLDALAWVHRCSTFDAAKTAGGDHG